MLTQKRPLRQSQLIFPWGIGQIIPFPEGECLMLCGLDAWENTSYENANDSYAEFIIKDERLAKLLQVKEFRLPPDYREYDIGNRNTRIKIPFVRFPQWHYCPRCGHMEKLSLYSPKLEICNDCSKQDKKYKWVKVIPVSFVAVCPSGHIQDFPFMEWVHQNKKPQEECKLTFKSGPFISVKCSCGEQNKLTAIFQDNILKNIIACQGKRPWLGEVDDTNKCSQDLKIVPISASNVYFPNVYSSIYLPNYEKEVRSRIGKILDKEWSYIAKKGIINQNYLEILSEKYNIDLPTLNSAAEQRLNNEKKRSSIISNNLSEEYYRLQEYLSIINGEGGDNQDFYVINYLPNFYNSIIYNYFSKISLIHKLRETRAFYGFSRIFPSDKKTLAEKKAELTKGENVDWLPAAVVYGEGVFLEFNKESIEKWENNNEILSRTERIKKHFYEVQKLRKLKIRKINPRFVLLHTFAHILINQFSTVCGYSSASLRERIYCNVEISETPMNGVLIYTASGDTDGSLGGLVRQGKTGNLESIVYSALQTASWCSADPICIQSTGQGPDSCNLAACHNCALIPECSCEEANRLLDRGMLIGTEEYPNIGYFSGFNSLEFGKE